MILCMYPSFLLQVSNHDNRSRSLLPHHPPEVINRVRDWTLSGYEGIRLVVALWL